MVTAVWLGANILLPIIMPQIGMLILILLLARNPTPPTGLNIMAVVKDGQLCWAAIGMGAASYYDVWEAVYRHRPVPEWSGLAELALLLLMLPAILVAAGGAVFPTPLKPHTGSATVHAQKAGALWAWLSHYGIFTASAGITLCAAAIYATLHLQIAA
jgi:hypothetical protein